MVRMNLVYLLSVCVLLWSMLIYTTTASSSSSSPPVVETCSGSNSNSFSSPQSSLFDDITESDLKQLATFFHFSYNEPTEERISYPVEGVVYGNNRRIIFPLIVGHHGTRIKTLFLYDTSSPFSYISQSTLKALKIEDLVLNSMNIALQGDLVTVHPTLSSFQHINIVGQEFFRGLKALVAIDYFKLKAKIFLVSNAYEELETIKTSSPNPPPSLQHPTQ